MSSALFLSKIIPQYFDLESCSFDTFVEQLLLRVSRSVILKNADKILLVFMPVCYTVSFFVIADG